ncbi:hypothetical protein MPTK1_3g15060 [Marchantia polymorpha subsp. ruderalis]|uniref:J domain-containing protein n=2 Tax=Marchantia polymorpha TaxID=3197 RepID=A0AAF6B0Z0_MARPO|nr:hypothetical protein MARPO_0004s0166 [Marchantia polymorpha]BBN05674.1 hypothetical protein Mp_3g15060 [Marchantia polymorpha subsp. ruderalis]|eukprot:PTQ48908.1 hypothetical protein MARPO_0004s0166 [Marchantia polymorpha]
MRPSVETPFPRSIPLSMEIPTCFGGGVHFRHNLAEKYVGHARLLMPSQDPADVCAAISLLDAALKLSPQWEKALELKARALLSLRRFKEVAHMLQDYIPSAKLGSEASPPESPLFGKDKVQLLSSYIAEEKSKRRSLMKYLAVSKLKKILITGLSRRGERNEWRYLVLGQACCHLGMMEDAMVLLQNGKKAACAAFRRESISLGEDSFCADAFAGPDSDFVSHLLGNIKFLLRRRAAALAAMEAGLYPEAVRHFSKILDGRRGTPQGFIAECYLYRALAHKASGRIPDAIADCNRTLALDPTCVEALSTRASLYEMIRCFYEALQDYKQLKGLYDALAQHQRLPRCAWRFPQNSSYMDVPSSLYQLDIKISGVKQRLESRYTIDYHTILGLTPGCTKNEVERAHLLICLKHRPDKASHFIDRCEFVDDRDIEAVKEEARLAATRLFRLIQSAHSGVMHGLVEEENEKRKRSLRCLQYAAEGAAGASRASLPAQAQTVEDVAVEERVESGTTGNKSIEEDIVPGPTPSSWSTSEEACSLVPASSCSMENSQCEADLEVFMPRGDEEMDRQHEQQLVNNISHSGKIAVSQQPAGSVSASVNSHQQQTGMAIESVETAAVVHTAQSAVCLSASECASAEAKPAPALTACREVLAVETKLAIVLSPSNWINSSEGNCWTFQNHHTPMPLQVT